MLPVLILYIDRDYEITYWIFGKQARIVSSISCAQALQLLKNVTFDLIVSDPMGLVLFQPILAGNPPAET